MPKNLFKKFNYHVVVIILISIIMFFAGYLIVKMIYKLYYEHMYEDTLLRANSYSENIETAFEATDIINKLLDDKIIAAGYAINYFDNNYSDRLLSDLAESMLVDEIYAYINEEITFASDGDLYKGWSPPPGHPVYKFMHDDLELEYYVGDIRQDTQSGEYLKYGYLRTESDTIIQIGIRAENIYEFLGSFEIKQLLNATNKDTNVDSAYYIDNFFNISSNLENDNTTDILNEDSKHHISNNLAYTSFFNKDGIKFYQVILPIFVNGQKAGSLAINYSVQKTQEMIIQVSGVAIIALAFIFMLLFGTTYSSYTKNKRLIQYTYFDHLTNLPNKRYLELLVKNEATINYKKRALMLVNYKNFKIINTTFGYHYGETIIKKLAQNLTSLSCENCIVIHLAADRFVFYIKSYNTKEELIFLSNNILKILKSTLDTKTIGAAIGIFETTGYNEDTETMLKKAFIAAGNIKEDETYGYCFFNEEMEEKLRREEEIQNELTKTYDKKINGFYLEYQPILDLKTNKIFGFEALARLNSDNLGFVSPMEFIPIAEKTQLIVPLGKQLLFTACRFLKIMESKGYDSIKMSVNISMIQLLRDDFIPDLTQILTKTKIDPQNLILEITESIFADNCQLVNKKLLQIKEKGITIALDDFGTGYSSLARESELSINCLKIDKHFADKLLTGDSEKAIIADIISMAHRIGHYVVAEGVESEVQKSYLLSNGCDCMQGYLFSKPLVQSKALSTLIKHN